MSDIPTLTTEQMIEVDRLMIEDYQITLIQMMENAGRNLAELTRRQLGGSVEGKQIIVLCGGGNNGGGGLVAARHLSNWGANIEVWLTGSADKLKDIPRHQWQALDKIPARKEVVQDEHRPDFAKTEGILDAMIGYGLQGDPRGTTAELIDAANGSGKPIIALDAPSGLDTTEGKPGSSCIKASATMTLALPKVGLMTTEAESVIGDLYLADISVPPTLYKRLGIEIENLFAEDTIIKVR